MIPALPARAMVGPPAIPDDLILPAILAVLVAVVASGGVARMLRSTVPLPLVQIAIGLAIGAATDLRLRIDPDMFMLLFLPPLLFLDAWRIPKDSVRRDLRIVTELAFGLVFVTVLGLGLFLHWLLPAMPLALCFALGAVLSPTDAVAVGAMTRRVPVPARLRHILEGEALLNDASALVCLRFASAALLAGGFSAGAAAATFLWVASAGLAIGFGLSWLVGISSARIARRFGEDPGAHILVTLLLPFGAYLLAEAVHASGILAAVAAGLAMTRVDRRAHRPAATRIQRHASWDTIAFALNGAVFVLLGEQLSLIVHLAEPSTRFLGGGGPGALVAVVLLVSVGLLLLRAIWVTVSMRIEFAWRPRLQIAPSPPWTLVAAATLSGVRGTVTLVAVLTLPRLSADGVPIPGSELAVMIATGVILVTLILGSIALPPVLRRLTALEAGHVHDPAVVGRLVAERAWPEVEALCDAVATPESAGYKRRYRSRAAGQDAGAGMFATLHLSVIEAERRAVFMLQAEARLDDAAAQGALAELDKAELFSASLRDRQDGGWHRI